MSGGSGGRREGEEDAPDGGKWAVTRYLVGLMVYSLAVGFVLKLLGF